MQSIAMWIIVVILVAGAAFFGGMQYATYRSAQTAAPSTVQNSGEVVERNAGSITIRAVDGTTKTYTMTDATRIILSDVEGHTFRSIRPGAQATVLATTDGSIAEVVSVLRTNATSSQP